MFLKADVFRFNEETAKWDLYEVKSSSEIKTDLMHNHIKDICFQKIVLEECGMDIGDCYLVHLNRDYIRKGNLDLIKLFAFEEVSERIKEVYPEVSFRIDEALALLKQDDLKLILVLVYIKVQGKGVIVSLNLTHKFQSILRLIFYEVRN